MFVSCFTRHEENYYDIINVIISKLAYKIYLFLVESWQSERDRITKVPPVNTLLFSGLSLCTLPLKKKKRKEKNIEIILTGGVKHLVILQ